MADIFDINYQIQVQNLIHPKYRLPRWLSYVFSLVFPLQYLRDIVLGDYKAGAPYASYNIGTTYSKGDRVIFTNKSVYESLTNSNTGNLPAGSEPASSLNWTKIQDVYIGVDELSKYNGQLIILGYAINKWFGATAPNLIYFVNNNGAGAGFNIHIPTALYNSLGSNNPDRDTVIFQFVNLYVVAGTTNGIVLY